MKTSEFELGLVTVTVRCLSGESHIEDWPPADAEAAREYAEETACCSDVLRTEFYDARTNETRTFAH